MSEEQQKVANNAPEEGVELLATTESPTEAANNDTVAEETPLISAETPSEEVAPAPVAAPVPATSPTPVVTPTPAPVAASISKPSVAPAPAAVLPVKQVAPTGGEEILQKVVPLKSTTSTDSAGTGAGLVKRDKLHTHSHGTGESAGIFKKQHRNSAVLLSGTAASAGLEAIAQQSKWDQNLEWAKEQTEIIFDSLPVVIAMAVITIWALFSDDLRVAVAPKSADDIFTGIITMAFFMFIFEIIAASFCKDDYLVVPEQKLLKNETIFESFVRRAKFGSFYFWSDMLATISLIFEIPWTGASLGGDELNRAGDTANTGARASKTIRLVRMVRLIRLVKLYKYTSKIREKEEELSKEGENKDEKDNDEEEEDSNSGQESRVGAAMTDLTNRRVIIMILIMLILVPLMSVVDTNKEPELAVSFIHALAYGARGADANDLSTSKTAAIEFSKEELQIVYLDIRDDGTEVVGSYRDDDKIALLRTEELEKYYSSTDNFVTTLWVDNSENKHAEATMAIYTTIFVIVVLIASSILFSADVTRLVITPIERMVELVSKISANPLGVEYKMLGAEDGFLDGMETTALLATITKIGRLMKVGFGEAGASVIAKNMSGDEGKLKLLGGGQMIHSIFGFCDVRQFTDTTECLQEEVMLFVNRIGHILHSIVVQCSGAANKNIGDAFLLTWKLEERWTARETSSQADQALLCFCKALVELGRYEEFIVNFSSASTARLYKRFPGYHVRIGSGLHCGWAVEGAIGSHRKIDASYLSPHVNFTEFLESSTKAYGTPLLISEQFYKLLSPAAAKFIRQVDRIRPAPTEEPLGLYTYDSDLNIDWADPNRKLISKKLMPTLKAITGKFRTAARRASIGAAARMALTPEEIAEEAEKKKAKIEAEKAAKAEESKRLQTPTIVLKEYHQDCWRGDPDLVDLRHRVNEKYRSTFHVGIEAYISGDWTKARETFEHTKKLSLTTGAPDGPSCFLLNFMEQTDFVPPEDWEGYRKEY